MGKGRKKNRITNSSDTFTSWRSQVKRMEQVYGYLKTPLWKKYPHLKEVITCTNNEDTFTPKPRNGNTNPHIHPYGREIRDFQVPLGYQIYCQKKLPTAPSHLNKNNEGELDYSAVWIKNEVTLQSLIAELSKRDHLFLDLEGHNVRSFRGITSLLQVFDEVHRTVYFVDTLELYHKMELFQPIFANPKIIKVMHGSHNDIRSFEKDFSLYVVGLMDTQMVFREYFKQNGSNGRFNNIEPSNISYKNLVNGFLPEVNLQKSETFTDFRQRPLHPSQQKYAFLDVWYLPHVYYKMISELSQSHIYSAAESSKKICLEQRYSVSTKDLSRQKEENLVLWQLRRLRHYIAVKEDFNPEYLSPPCVLVKLLSGAKPQVDNVFLSYPAALQTALKGEDPVPVLETKYSDLGTQFPYYRPTTPPPTPQTFFCCKHWEVTDHLTKDCKLTKAEVKEIKKKHYQKEPEKRKARNRYFHKKERNTAEKRTKHNKKTLASKKKNQTEGYVRRRNLYLEKKAKLEHARNDKLARRICENTTQIQKRQVEKGIILGTRKRQYHMLKRQEYRDKVACLLPFEN